ncbi:hypothetical protein AFLA_002926 [Aspergillus flavus NRRL3357]|nr:hypothetical protein AFLA_002926 [Aspergillus flavus NRRL3357]
MLPPPFYACLSSHIGVHAERFRVRVVLTQNQHCNLSVVPATTIGDLRQNSTMIPPVLKTTHQSTTLDNAH